MQYTRLGKSDLLVSRICMGCMGFGDPSTGQHSWTLDETASRDIIRYGLEKGINFYDTAIAYQNGSSERYVTGHYGRWRNAMISSWYQVSAANPRTNCRRDQRKRGNRSIP